MIMIREGKTLKNAKYWIMDNDGKNKKRISYKKACEIEDLAVYEKRVESYRTLCNNFVCIGRIKD